MLVLATTPAGPTFIQILGAVGAVFGIVAAVVGVALYVRGSYAKVRIEALREDLEDERKSSESLRSRVTDLEKENGRVQGRMAAIERENKVLRAQPALDIEKVLVAISEARNDVLRRIEALVGAIRHRGEGS